MQVQQLEGEICTVNIQMVNQQNKHKSLSKLYDLAQAQINAPRDKGKYISVETQADENLNHVNTQSSQLDYDQLVTLKKEMKSKIKKQSSDLKQFKEVIATQQL